MADIHSVSPLSFLDENQFRQRMVDDWLNGIITSDEFEEFAYYWWINEGFKGFSKTC